MCYIITYACKTTMRTESISVQGYGLRASASNAEPHCPQLRTEAATSPAQKLRSLGFSFQGSLGFGA